MTQETTTDICSTVIEAQKRHARGVNDCQSIHVRRKPDGSFFCFQIPVTRALEVICPDGVKRHSGNFLNHAEALKFQEWGHACLANGHTIQEVLPTAREEARRESSYENLSVYGKALWDALWEDNQKPFLLEEHADGGFTEFTACEECGHVGEHTSDCATGYVLEGGRNEE